MVWLGWKLDKASERDGERVKPVWQSVEERLIQIEKSQTELNREAQEIKSIARSIVQELGLEVGATEILKRLSPLLSEMPPALRSIEGQLDLIRAGQDRLQSNMDRLELMISRVSEQLTMARP